MYFELHRWKLVQDIAHWFTDGTPGDLVVRLSSGFNGMPCHVVETYHVAQHTHRFVEGTKTIVCGITSFYKFDSRIKLIFHQQKRKKDFETSMFELDVVLWFWLTGQNFFQDFWNSWMASELPLLPKRSNWKKNLRKDEFHSCRRETPIY